jgi:DNA repair protein RecN (Recombination protein N)
MKQKTLIKKLKLSEKDFQDIKAAIQNAEEKTTGEIAVAVGSHMKNLAKNRQIFCITHLASIAVYADNQVKIEKGVVSGKTSSVARNIDGEERVEEIARMLSGDANTQQSLEHARAMLLKYRGGN